MFRSLRLRRKLVAIWSLFSLTLNILQPAFLALTLAPVIAPSSIKAEEVADPSAEPSALPIESVAPSADPTAEPTISPDPSPSPDLVSPEPSASADASIEPIASVEPSAEPTIEPSVAPESNPPATEPSQDSSPAPPRSEAEVPRVVEGQSPLPTPTPSAFPNLNEQLDIAIVDHTAAASIEEFDLTVTETGSATLSTDKADYAPTDTALITGSGFLPSTTYSLTISSADAPSTSTTASVTTDAEGKLFYAYQLDGIYRPNYKVEAYLGSTLVATVTFTDSNPSANLDQCANDPAPSLNSDGCSASASDWVNGNVNESKALYLEGDSIPYRMLLDNLTLASHTVIIEWDTTKGGKHAIDYLTTFNSTVTTANPCLGVSGCSTSTPFPIPADPQVTGAGVTPIAGNFTLYGGTITAVSAYTYPDGTGFLSDKSARIAVTFTANQANPVLAWGGHIATRADWGATNAATAISGSPYHTRLISLDGSGGNQDRSLDAGAVIFPGSITIIKQATPEGSQSFAFTASPSPLTNFSLIDNGTTANTRLFSNITNFQTYNVAETVPSAWTLNSIVCGVTSPNGGSQTVNLPGVGINLKEGENVTCTFNNQQQAAHLIVIKHVVNDDGGTSVASDFTMTINGITATGGNTFPGAEAPGTDKVVAPGSYSVSESGPAGYTASYSTDCTGTIAAGQTKTCTVTNDDQQSYIIVDKTVINDNGGTAAANDFLLKVDGNAVLDAVAYPVNPGVHTASETLLSGYTAGSWGGDCSTGGSVTVALGQTKTCTITNNDIAPSLTLVKTVTNDNGGSAVATNWTLSATGPTSISGAGGATSDATFDAGSYALSESAGPTGYAAGSWVCVGGTQNGASITLSVGQTATCTINNNDIAPQLTVIKHVINNNGGNKVAGDFTMNVTGSSVSDESFPGAENPGTTVTLNAGAYSVDENNVTGYAKNLSTDCSGTIAVGEHKTCTITNDDVAPTLTLVKTVINNNGGNLLVSQVPLFISGSPAVSGTPYNVSANTLYTATETQQTGYLASAWGGDCAANGTITLLPGDNKTCTITNDDIAPVLTFIKVVNNNYGGTLGIFDFPLYINGSLVTSGVANTLSANTLYTLTELQQYGYTGGTISGDCATNGTITLLPGQTKTCYITNNDVQPKLTVTKVVINDNGGTKQITDFPLFVKATGVVSGVQNGYNAGTYTVSETNLPGYSATISGDCNPTTGSVSLAVGDVKSCTITNNDQPGTLIVNKIVINDNGGNAEADDFSYQIDGATAVAFEVDGSNSQTVDSGYYTITEPSVSGYATSYNNCTRVFVPNGGSATCTITNDDIAPTITLNKIVLGSQAAGVNSFGLTIGATSVTSGQTLTVSANTAYALNEAGLTGYSFTSLTGHAKCPSALGGTVTLDEDEDITCTITNTRDLGSIQITKLIDADGDNSTTDDRTPYEGWVMDVDPDGSDTSDPSLSPTNSSGVTSASSLKTGTYWVTEDSNGPTDNYHFLDSYCLIAEVTTGNSGTGSFGGVQVSKDQTTYCTFVNVRDTGTITVDKITYPTGDQTNFDINLNQGLAEDPTLIHTSTLADQDTPDTYKVVTGEYWLEEILSDGTWDLTDAYCMVNDDVENTFDPRADGFVVSADDHIYCTFENTKHGNVTVTKYSDDNGNGEWDENEDVLSGWGINLSKDETLSEDETDENGEVVFTNLIPGTYDLSEDLQEGWQQTNISCSNDSREQLVEELDNSHSVEVTPGGEITCEIGNQAEPKLRIQKSNDASGNKNPGDTVTYTLVVDLTGSSLSGVTLTDVTPDGFVVDASTLSADKNGSLFAVSMLQDYASPGIWDLGDMEDGDVITLTYKTKIASDQDGGTYNDIAWAEGGSKGWGRVLALGHDSEYVDNIFVGTDVTISKISEQTGSVDIEGEVLGASTELPATGANTGWLLFAIGLFITGLSLVLGRKRMRYLTVLLVSVFSFFTSYSTSKAIDYPNLSVRAEQPQSPTNDNDWKLSYAVLDRLERTPSVSCFVKKPGSGSFVQFGDTKTSSKTAGDNGSCQVNSSVISNGQGSYEFYVTASSTTGEAESKNSATVTVVYDTEGPDKPVSYTKEHPSSCQYVIKFKTANDDGKTTSIQIFGSKETSFDTNNSTRVGGVNIGSDQEGSFNHDLVGDDCSRTWYYVIRAYDASGNQSGHLGDEVVTIGAPVTTTTPALVVTTAAGSVLGEDQSVADEGSESGEVLGDGEQEETVEATGLIESVRDAVNNASSTKKLWWIFDILAILVIIYVIARKSKST